MNNLFLKNVDDVVLRTQEALKANIKFLDKIILDLKQTFDNVYIEKTRKNQDIVEFNVWTNDQKGRWGWSVTFTAFPDGVKVKDNRGIKVSKALNIFNLNLVGDDGTETYWLNDTDHPIFWKKFENELKQNNFFVSSGDCYNSTSRNGCRLVTYISENDKDLDFKIKIIVRILLTHGLTTKLE